MHNYYMYQIFNRKDCDNISHIKRYRTIIAISKQHCPTWAGASQLLITAYDHCIFSSWPPWRTETADSAVARTSCRSRQLHLTLSIEILCSTAFTKLPRLSATTGWLLWWSLVCVKGQLCGMEKNSAITSLSSGEIPAILVSSLMIVREVSKP